MKRYTVQVVDASNRRRTEKIQAAGTDDLMAQIAAKGLTLVSIDNVASAGRSGTRLSGRETYELFEALSSLTDAGLTIQEALEIAATLSFSPTLNTCLDEIRVHIGKGEAFARAVQLVLPRLPLLLHGMLEIGERSGKLGSVLRHSLQYLAMTKTLREKIISASIYPILVLSVMVVGIVLLATVLLPKLEAGLGNVAGRAGNFTSGIAAIQYLLFILLSLLAIAGLLAILYRDGARRESAFAASFERIFLKVPLIGPAILASELYSLCFALEVLTESSLPLQNSLEIGAKIPKMIAVRKAVQRAADDVEKGQRLSESFEGTGVMPHYFIRWIHLSERTGKISGAFAQLRLYYQQQLDIAIARITSLVEPILIALVGGLLILVISLVIVPLFTMYNIKM